MIDRHARHRRTPLDRHRRPVDGYRTRSTDRFAQLVGDALRSLPAPLLAEFDTVDVAVGDIPVLTEDDDLVLATSGAADATTRRERITLFRRPLEARARDRHDLRELVRDVLVQELAQLRGFDDDRLHQLGWD
jgi:predicted Zn-dependent protease with MMP-like domain